MIGRPAEIEAAPYYFTYIDQVSGEDPLAVIEHQLDDTLSVLARVSEEQSQFRYAPGKWSLREMLNHIADTERTFAFRAFWFARGFESPLPSFDQDIAASRADANRIAWAGHMEEFRGIRLSTISLFRNLPSEAWMRSGIASEKRFTVRAMAFIIAGHTTHHLAILRERYNVL